MPRVGKIIDVIKKLQLAYGRGDTFMTSAGKRREVGGSLEVYHAFAAEGKLKIGHFLWVS